MKIDLIQKKDTLTTFITKDFKEFIENQITNKADFDESYQLIEQLELDYKDYNLIVDCFVTYSYEEESGDGYWQPREGGYQLDNYEFENLIIYKGEDLINKTETKAILNFLNK